MGNEVFNEDDKLLEEMLSKDGRLAPLAFELGEKFSEITIPNKLSAGDGLQVVARFAAAYVHVLQSDLKTAQEKDTLEDTFAYAFRMYLAYFDMMSVMEEEDKEKRRHMN